MILPVAAYPSRDAGDPLGFHPKILPRYYLDFDDASPFGFATTDALTFPAPHSVKPQDTLHA